MDVSTIRRANLDAAIRQVGGKVELARKMGKNPNYLSQVHRPDGPNEKERPIGGRLARSVEQAMGWGRGHMDVIHAPANEGNTGTNDRPIRRLRLVSWSQAGRHDESMSLGAANDDAAVVYADASIGQGAYALRVRGDSMVDGSGILSFPADSIIVVDPSITAKPGDPVVVQLQGAAEAVFKILEFDGQQNFLKPLNPRYPIAPMPIDAIILGVVVLVQIDTLPRLRR